MGIEEMGVWRTVRGRRVFIVDGQMYFGGPEEYARKNPKFVRNSNGKIVRVWLTDGQKDDTIETEKTECRLSYEEEAAIRKYASSESYVWNEKLRSGEPLSEAELRNVAALNAALDKLPVYRGTVIRVLSIDEDSNGLKSFISKHQIGCSVVYPAFTSASTKEGYSDSANIKLYIHSKSGRDFRMFNPEENEILFKIGAKFMVKKSLLENTDRFIAEMEEL